MILQHIYSGNYTPNFIRIVLSFVEDITENIFLTHYKPPDGISGKHVFSYQEA